MRKFEVAKGFENRGVILPTRATEGSAGYDIRVLTPDKKSIEIKPLEGYVFDTGIKACMGKDEVLKIYIRSSVGIKKHLILSNVVGIIDSDFYNNIGIFGDHLVAAIYWYRGISDYRYGVRYH